jgi:hypothetical protein
MRRGVESLTEAAADLLRCTARRIVSLLAIVLGLAGPLGACTPKPLLPFTTDTPPVLLATAGPENGIEDRRGRFRQILCAVAADHGRNLADYRPCDEILWRLRDEPAEPDRPTYLGPPRLPLRILIVGGLAAECVTGYVSTLPFALQHLNRLGYRTDVLPVSGLGGTGYNGRLIASEVMAMELAPNERIVLVGHSKGAVDILQGVTESPEAARRVAAVVSLAGAINGSPLVENAPEQLFLTVRYLPGGTCRLGDGNGLNSLRRARRLAWLSSHRLPEDVRFYSLAAFAERESISLALRVNYDRLSQMDPRNDGQLLFYDQIIPGGALLGYLNADHWAVAMPLDRMYPVLSFAFADRAAFPREMVFEAIVRQIEEDLLQDEAKPNLSSDMVSRARPGDGRDTARDDGQRQEDHQP